MYFKTLKEQQNAQSQNLNRKKMLNANESLCDLDKVKYDITIRSSKNNNGKEAVK